MDLIDGLSLTDALAAHRQDRGAAWPVLHHPRRSRHAPQRPGEVAPAHALTLAGLEWHSAAVREPVADDLKSPAATVFDGNPEVSSTQLKVEKKPRFACSGSASIPSSSSRSRSCRRAAISPPASVARCSGQWPRPACWSRGSTEQCRRSRPEAIMRSARGGFSYRAPQ